MSKHGLLMSSAPVCRFLVPFSCSIGMWRFWAERSHTGIGTNCVLYYHRVLLNYVLECFRSPMHSLGLLSLRSSAFLTTLDFYMERDSEIAWQSAMPRGRRPSGPAERSSLVLYGYCCSTRITAFQSVRPRRERQIKRTDIWRKIKATILPSGRV